MGGATLVLHLDSDLKGTKKQNELFSLYQAHVETNNLAKS